jgi:hypothetical protein
MLSVTTVGAMILSNPQTYDGQPVAIQGTVQKYTTRQTPRGGTVSTYQVCDQQCVTVPSPEPFTPHCKSAAGN